MPTLLAAPSHDGPDPLFPEQEPHVAGRLDGCVRERCTEDGSTSWLPWQLEQCGMSAQVPSAARPCAW